MVSEWKEDAVTLTHREYSRYRMKFDQSGSRAYRLVLEIWLRYLEGALIRHGRLTEEKVAKRREHRAKKLKG